jgi:hypothetical protein
MEIQPRPETGLSVGQFVRWGLHGGAAAALIPLLNGVTTISSSALDPLLILVAGTILGGGLPTLVVMALSRSRNPLAYVESSLSRARMMVERRLIDEEDYQRIKRHTLEVYQASPGQQRPLWPVAFWGMVTITAMFSLLRIGDSYVLQEVIATTALTALAGGSLVGGAAQAYATFTGAGHRAGLPAPKGNRLLGE